MPLSAGRRLGHYAVTALLGTGLALAVFLGTTQGGARSATVTATGHMLTWAISRERLLALVRREAPDVFTIEHNCSDRPYFEEILKSDVDAVSFAYVDERAIQTQHGWDCHDSHTHTNVCSERFCLRPPVEASAAEKVL